MQKESCERNKSEEKSQFKGIKCAHTDLVDIDSLVPNPRNPNKHSEQQIKLLAKIIRHQGFRNPIVVSKRSGFITKGHGRLEAAKLLGLSQVPIDRQDYSTEADEYADMVADNKIAELSESDMSMIQVDAANFPDLDLDLLGIPDFSLDIKSEVGNDSAYTSKIESPIYTPKGEKPKLGDLYNLEKMQELLTEIGNKNLSQEEKQFLTFAAYRHIVFNYELIAEFYAHANKEIQELMENSALVIIDFNKAIEKGFVKMTNEIAETFKSE